VAPHGVNSPCDDGSAVEQRGTGALAGAGKVEIWKNWRKNSLYAEIQILLDHAL
jgi:hypothetical protein